MQDPAVLVCDLVRYTFFAPPAKLSSVTKSRLAIFIGAIALLFAFLPLRPGNPHLERIRASFSAAEEPLRAYEAVPVDILAAAIPKFEAIDSAGAPEPVSRALEDFIASMHECVRLMRLGDTPEARLASRAVEDARARLIARMNEARGAPF